MTTPAQIDHALASTLSRLRKERGLTQEGLAHEADITVAALARIERGQANPTWSTVRKIASAVGVGMEELGAAVERVQR
jgi:transcriptional regulator with XRE-family HTH domain